MTSHPHDAPSPVDWVANADTGRLSCWFELDQEGWILVLSFASYSGAVQLIGAGIHFAGTLSPLDVVQGVNEGPVPDLPADHRFRYRWLRDVGQQYERGARTALRGSPTLVAVLASGDWYESDAPTKGHGLTFYAEVARDFVGVGGSIEKLSAMRHVAYDTAHGWVKKARRHGLLNSPGRGRRGHADLTQLGREVLDGKH